MRSKGTKQLLCGPHTKGGQPERFEIVLDRSGRYLLNPGSVGQPRDSDWRAAFALFDSDEGRMTYFRIPYAVEQAQQKILEAGLPEALAARLRLGR